MKKRIVLSLLVLIVIAIVLSVPYFMSASSLREALAAGTDEAHEAVITALVGGPYEVAALRAVAAEDERLAVDTVLGAAAYVVAGDGRAHVVVVALGERPSAWDAVWASVSRAFTGSAAPAVSPRSYSRTSSGSVDSETPFVGVHHLTTEGPFTSFVLRMTGAFTRCVTTQHGYSPGETSHYGVSDDNLAQWRDMPSWPAGW